MDSETILYGIGAAPIITALIQPLKRWIPEELIVYVAVAVGVAWNVGLSYGTDEFSRATIFLGVVTGLAAAGVYNVAGNVVNRVR